jgi:hypothetical protein
MNAAALPEVTVEALETGAIDAGAFDHEAHVYAAWLFLDRYRLPEAIARFCGALERLTRQLGVPGKYHETVTWFYMLLIAERRDREPALDWFAFRRHNDDLFARGGELLARYYRPETLASKRARRAFLLPDRIPD